MPAPNGSGAPYEPVPGRSVFEDPPSSPENSDPDTSGAGRNDTTDVLPVVESHRPPAGAPRGRPVLDGAAFGLYEDDRGRGRAPLVIGGLLAVATLIVGFLVWRAVNTDADLDLDLADEDSPTAGTAPEDPVPTVEELRALIPDGLDTCAPLGEPEGAPPRVSLLCPRAGVPEAIGFVLFATISDRAEEFDRLVEDLGIGDPGDDGSDCVLGPSGVHDYIGFERVGRVACAVDDEGIVDFVWTTDEAPLLVRARGPGPFSDHYAFWDRVVERTDAAFPVPEERSLIGRLPEGLDADCRRDTELNVSVDGVAAVVCDPSDDGVDLVSSVQFPDAAAMSGWIEDRRSSLSGYEISDDTGACSPSEFGGGEPPETATSVADTAPAPAAGFTTYDIDGRTGRILCFVNSNDTSAVFWTRDDPLIGSIAVVEDGDPGAMRDLLAWWEAGGHKP